MTFTRALATNNYGPCKFIVDGTTVANGTHSTIAAALTSASSGDTIFIRPGTYTENLTLKAGVNLTAFDCDAFTPNVTISGTCTFTTAGTVTISGIRLQTNSAFAVAVTGSAASILNLVNCFLNCSNNTGISFTSSSASAQINLLMCNARVGTTGITLFSHSSAGVLFFDRTYIDNPGASTTNSTCSAGFIFFQYCYNELPLTTSGTGVYTASFCHFSTFATNTKTFTSGGDANAIARHCCFKSGTATAITVTTGLNLQESNIESTNATIIDGAGTLTYNPIQVSSTGAWAVTTTTQTLKQIGPSATVGSTNAGATNTLTIQNASNTASSNALQQVSVAGTSAGDAFQTFTVSGTTNWSQGVDNSDSDAYVLAASNALGTTNVMRVSTAGEINHPLQPAFLAYLGTSDLNVTGDGTFALLGAGNALTEIFDQGGDFATSGLFTAPVTGRYTIGATIYVGGLTSAMTTGYVRLSASNRAFDNFYCDPFDTSTAANQLMMGINVLMDMDAADTVGAYAVIESGTKVADLIGGSTPDNCIFGFLSC